METTSANGMFSVCASGNVSIQITCNGTSCAGLTNIPGVTCANDTTSVKCSNNVACDGASNFTSSFAIQQTNLTVSQKQNISIGDQQFILTGAGSNFTSVNNTSPSAPSGARSWKSSRRNSLLQLLVGIIVTMLATQAAAAQSPFSGLDGQFSGALGPLLEPLEHLVCSHVGGEIISDPFQKAGLEMEAMTTCLSLVAAAELVAGAELVAAAGGELAAVGGAVIGDTLPITFLPTLFGAIVVDGAICMALVYLIFSEPFEEAASQVCDALTSSPVSTPTQSTMSTTPTTSSTVSTPTNPISSSIPPDFPSAAALAGDPCVATQLSVYYLGVQGLAQTCSVSKPSAGAWDMSTVFCDPSIRPRYPTVCTEFCNTPCGSYDLQTLITDAGSAFNPSANLATISQVCPGFVGTGRCTTEAPSCTCGVGASTCVAATVGCIVGAKA